MTKVMEWLKAKAPGFDELSEAEQNAIADFSLLWSLFENRILNTEGNAAKICAAVESWHNANTLDTAAFAPELAYFRNRYFANGTVTGEFAGLKLRNPDREPLVRAVIDGSDNDPRNLMAAILIIVFRFRNNLFHGDKWRYKLKGQLGNFTTANDVLTKVLDRHGGLAEG
ncbi:hypothetical protein [Phyllobacterium sp. SB3]|uniref:hypothetical protein n=1 Tax=Phyllobacterium sp. SB3 TaxID=3156073 RepID=UPI0032AEC8F9